MDLLTNIIVAALSSGIVGTIIVTIATRKKTSNEAKDISSQTSERQVKTSLELMESYKTAYEEVCLKLEKLEKDMSDLSKKFNEKIQVLTDENNTLRADNEELRLRVEKLEAQVISMGGHPVTKQKPRSSKTIE